MNKRQRKKAAKRLAEKERQRIAEKSNVDFHRAVQELHAAIMEVGKAVGKVLVEAADVINAELSKQQKQG